MSILAHAQVAHKVQYSSSSSVSFVMRLSFYASFAMVSTSTVLLGVRRRYCYQDQLLRKGHALPHATYLPSDSRGS